MRIPPLDVILSWPAPDYEHPKTRGNALLVTITIFSILVVAAVGGRFYSRLKINKWFGLDDIFIALALVCGGISCQTSPISLTSPSYSPWE